MAYALLRNARVPHRGPELLRLRTGTSGLHPGLGAARQLAKLAGAVREELWAPAAQLEIAYIGGVFQSGTLLETFRMLVEAREGVQCVPPRRGPAEGALRAAYRSAGLEIGFESGG